VQRSLLIENAVEPKPSSIARQQARPLFSFTELVGSRVSSHQVCRTLNRTGNEPDCTQVTMPSPSGELPPDSKLVFCATVWVPGKPRDHLTTLTVFVLSAHAVGNKLIDDAFDGVPTESTPIHSDKHEIDTLTATTAMDLGSFVRLLLQGDMMAVQVRLNQSRGIVPLTPSPLPLLSHFFVGHSQCPNGQTAFRTCFRTKLGRNRTSPQNPDSK
jgi:hypothetical protein